MIGKKPKNGYWKMGVDMGGLMEVLDIGIGQRNNKKNISDKIMGFELLKYRALELLKDVELAEPVTYETTSPYYPLIIKTAGGKMNHYFIIDDNGELFYDGWDKECICPIEDVCEN
jgi:hypothetical protein